MLTTGLPDKREKRKTNVIPPASDLGAKKIKTILYLHRLLRYARLIVISPGLSYSWSKLLLKAVYYTVVVYNFNLQEKTT